MIFLFTDFGTQGPYLGQVRAVLAAEAAGTPVIDLQNDAPAFAPAAAAHLLAALVPQLPASAIVLGVIDPGVGTERLPVAVEIDSRWFVGPDNGLFEVAAARGARTRWFEIVWRPPILSASFHGRDLFAPLAAALARGGPQNKRLSALPARSAGGADLSEVIYIDGYGNAMTGLRAARIEPGADLLVADQRLPQARSFNAVPAGTALWYANSLGLVEVAVNQGSAARTLGLTVGSPVTVRRKA